jgi:hypothetical protein
VKTLRSSGPITVRNVRDYVLQIEDYLLDRAGNKPVAQMLALDVCRAARNVSNDAEATALRDGFLLALYLANTDRDHFHSLVQRQNAKRAYPSRKANMKERNDKIRARAMQLQADHPWKDVVKILATEFVLKRDRIRRIIQPLRTK